jgi:hypothetical protein
MMECIKGNSNAKNQLESLKGGVDRFYSLCWGQHF